MNVNAVDENDLFDDLFPRSHRNRYDGVAKELQDLSYDGVTKELQDLSYDGKCPVYRTTSSRRAAKTYLSPGRRLILDHYYLESSSWVSESGEPAWFEPTGDGDKAGSLIRKVSWGRLTTMGRRLLGAIGRAFGIRRPVTGSPPE